LAVALLSSSAQAVRIPVGEDSALNFAVLMQPRVELDDGFSPSGNLATDFYVRRARFNITGNLGKLLVFQLQADMPRIGFRGNYNFAPFLWQDANLSFTPIDGLFLQGGFMVIPLSRGELGSSAAFQTVDLLGAPIRMLSDAGLRETGFQVRYIGLDKKLNARIGAFEGLHTTATLPLQPPGTTTPLNPDRTPKLAGYVQYSILGAEPTETFNGIYFSEKPIVSVGVGGQYMSKAVVTGTAAAPVYNDYGALAGSIFVEFPFSSDFEVVGEANVYKYYTVTGDPNNGIGFTGDFGVRFGKLEPVISFQHFSGDAHTRDFRRPAAGLNWWIAKHAANLKFEVAKEWSGDLTRSNNLPSNVFQPVTNGLNGAVWQYLLQAQMVFQ
jgi:hypothetical protein